MGGKSNVVQKNKKIKTAELFVSASPHAVERAIKESHEIDEAKLKELLRDINSWNLTCLEAPANHASHLSHRPH